MVAVIFLDLLKQEVTHRHPYGTKSVNITTIINCVALFSKSVYWLVP